MINILLQFVLGVFWILIRRFLFEKYAFNRLLKVIGIQIYLEVHLKLYKRQACGFILIKA